MWNNQGPTGPPRGGPTDPNNNNDVDGARRDSEARVAAVSALAAFAHGSRGNYGGAPVAPYGQYPHDNPLGAGPPAAAASRAYSAGYAPQQQHPMFLPSSHGAGPYYPPQHYPGTATPSSNSPPGPFYGHEYANAGPNMQVPPSAITSHSRASSSDRANSPSPSPPAPIVPRGKPEAMAARLAALQVDATRQELLEEEEEQQQQQQQQHLQLQQLQEDDDDDDDDDDDSVQHAAATPAGFGDDDDNEAVAEHVTADGGILANLDRVAATPAKSATTKKKAPASSKPKSRPAASSTSAAMYRAGLLPPPDQRTERLLEEQVPPITEAEYLCLQDLMVQFCKVPLLNEFIRPVALLHPELMASYSKIVSHPIDMGRVCRGIKARKYANTRDVRLDMWRVFSNCVMFHSHPNNKDALPSFVSIGLHLREYFNALWDEYMLPSDLPDHASPMLKAAFAKRTADRNKRLDNSGVLVTGKQHLVNTKTLLEKFIQSGACVDRLDTVRLWNYTDIKLGSSVESDLREVVLSMETILPKLAESAEQDELYALSQLHGELMDCLPSDLFEHNPALRIRIVNRINRFFWKRFSPLHEANSRGVTQSSIWGNVAATVWARESSKKPFWPALCLGILSPPDQRESWHATVTERNENRLPEKLRTQLVMSRHKCEQTQAKQGYSWFLVEFLGTHEFIWIRETDIVDSFDPAEDPNKSENHASKRKRTPRNAMHSAISSKTYATAVSECVWASEEYETTLMDAYDEDIAGDDDNDANFTFAALAEADDDVDDDSEYDFHHDVDNMSVDDIDEANYLLAHDGATNFDTKKKKPPPKRSPAKKKPVEKEKKESVDAMKKAKADLAKRKVRAKEEKKEQRELERRRKKRTRDREKALKEAAARKNKRPRSLSGVDDDDRELATDKRARATAIVKAYLLRMAKSDEEYRSLALNGVTTIPAAMIESTGLIAMALAFRAAAGELTMPDDTSEAQIAKNNRPWEAVEGLKAKASSERSAALEKQIKLLEGEIDRVKKNSARRQELAEEAVARRVEMDNAIEADDTAARVNHFRKKKKASPAKPKSKSTEKSSVNGGEEDEDDGNDDEESVAAAEPVVEGEVVDDEDDGDEESERYRKGSEADTLAESVALSEMDGTEQQQDDEEDAVSSLMQVEAEEVPGDDDKTAAAEAIAALAGFGGP